MTDPLARDYANSAAVLIGSWTYEALPSVPAAQNSLARMESLLTGELCGWPRDRVFAFGDEPDLHKLNLEIAQRFEPVRDVALFYYVGHGQPDGEDQLCLALPGTRQEANLRRITSLGFQEVRRALNYSRAQTKIVILDCCFSGLATRPDGTLSDADMLTMTGGTGAVVITASGAYNTAWFEQGEAHPKPHTYFTRYLAEVIERGIPGRPTHLTLGHIYTALADALQRDSLPSPTSNVRDRAGDFVFARNASPQRVASPAQDAEAVRRLLGDVEQQTLKMLEARYEAAKRDLDEFKAGQAQRAAEHSMLLRSGAAAASLPFQIRLLDLLEFPAPAVDPLLDRWAASEGSGRAVIGAGHEAPFVLDLSQDGPHVLITGASGAGKSEFLRTVLTSLALAEPPTKISFMLLNHRYDGFREWTEVPHVTNVIGTLDPHEAGRLLASLEAEVKRRALVLSEFGVAIDGYQQRRIANPLLDPLPRLVVAIDEFDAVEREFPELVAGIVALAPHGLTVGVHFLLATQPTAATSTDILGMSNMRVALRLADEEESRTVIGAPDAAHIARSTPGRAYARVGSGTLASFQVGWSAGFVESDDWLAISAVVRSASTRRGDALPRPTVMPALPAKVELAALQASGQLAEHGEFAAVPFGLEDRPDELAQVAALLNLAKTRHLLIAGAPRSGRTQALLTIATAFARAHSCEAVHIYAIDCGTASLLSLTRLPHCGAVVPHFQRERVVRLLTRLRKEVGDRLEWFSERELHKIAGHDSPVGDEYPPRIILMIDRWESFVTAFEDVDAGRPVDMVRALMTEGDQVGVHVVIAGDRQVLSGRLSGLAGETIALQLADRQDYRLIGNFRTLPDEIPAGRAFRAGDGREIQIALLARNSSAEAQDSALVAFGKELATRDKAVPIASRPFRLDALPARVSFEQAWELRDPALADRAGFALVGVGGDELTGFGPDLLEGQPAFVVAGPRGSGRSTLLMAMGRSLASQGSHIVVFAPKPSPLLGMSWQRFTRPDTAPRKIADALNAIGRVPAVLIVDDADLLLRAPAGDLFDEIARGLAGPGRALVFAGSTEELSREYSGWSVKARQAKRGALLCPQEMDHGELIGARLQRSQIREPLHPGRALLHLGDGVIRKVQVPID